MEPQLDRERGREAGDDQAVLLRCLVEAPYGADPIADAALLYRAHDQFGAGAR